MNRIGCGVSRVLFVVTPPPPLAIHEKIKQMGSGPKIILRTYGLTPVIDLNWKGHIIDLALVQSKA
jgi:hypothetical protein